MNFSVIKIYQNERNSVAKLGTFLISFDLLLAVSYLIFVEKSILTLIILFLFTIITIIWMILNQILLSRIKVDDEAYLLKPLGTELIKEFNFVDSSDQFFIDLSSILLPIAGKPYETKSIEVAAYLAKKYNVKITLLHVNKNGFQNNAKKGFSNAELILNEYNIKYNLQFRKGNNIPQEIVNAFHEGNYQLIVLASRRKSGVTDRLFVKSISKYVVNKVECAVLQVHPPRYKKRERDIGDIFLMLDGTERDAYLSRWAKMVSSVGIESKKYAYHVLQLPGIFPLDEAHKVPAIQTSKYIFENYASNLGKRFGLSVKPIFLYGHNIEKAIQGEAKRYEPDVIIIGHTKDKGWIRKLKTPLSYRLMNTLDATVIVHHMPANNKINQ